MTIRRIIKPDKQDIIHILEGGGCSVLPYQYVNWWLYMKGSDEIIWSTTDYKDLYFFIWNNRWKVVLDMAKILGISHEKLSSLEKQSKYEYLFD